MVSKGPNKNKPRNEFRRGSELSLNSGQAKLRIMLLFQRPKGELGGPGKFVNQDRLVANAQRSFSLKFHWPSRHEGFSAV